MDRRTFLAAATSVGLGGCIGLGDASHRREPSHGSPTVRAPSPTSSTPESGLFADFEDFSRWETVWGTATADSDRYHTGTQSARIEISTDDRRGAIDRQFDRSVDFTGFHFAMAMRSDSLCYPRLQIFDANGDRVDFRCQLTSKIPFRLYDLGIHRIVGSADLSAVSKLRIQEYTGGNEHKTIWCDAIYLGPRPDTGKVLVQFDDGAQTDYTVAYPVLEEYGYPATTFPSTNKTDIPGKLNLDQFGELQDAGWLVGNHTVDHPFLSKLSLEEKNEQIVGAKEWLVYHGFERGASYFTFPYGDYDATALEIVDDNHALSFAGGFPGYGEVVSSMLIGRQGELKPPAARRAIDIAVEWRGIATLFFHRLSDSSRPTISEFESIVEYLHEREASGDVDIITPVDIKKDLQSSVG